MHNKLFPVYEVGSMPKLNARVKAFRTQSNNTINDEDLQQIKNLAKKVQIDSKDILETLLQQKKDGRKLTKEEKQRVADFNALLNLKLQEICGLDFVYDGEARRCEMYRHCAKQIKGFEDYPEMLRSRGPDSWLASICSDVPTLNTHQDNIPEVKELQFVKKHAKNSIKVPLDDPYMIANMTGNRYFIEKFESTYDQEPQKLRYESKRALTLAIAQNVIRPQVEALVQSGANFIQLDIPSATIDLQHMPIMVEGINTVTRGFHKTKFSLHICYPKRVSLINKTGYELLFPHILKLNENVDHLSIELANGNQYREDLSIFAKYQRERKFELGIGVIDITLERQIKNLLETPEEVRDRILLSVEILKDPLLIYVAPDCGLRQVSLERTIEVFDTLSKGAELARKG